MAQRILIVDDEAKIRELLALFFKKENFVIAQAADGVEAIRKVESFKPNMVILDVMMPVLDGIETCKQIRRFSNVPIIMLTARGEDEDRILGLEIGADDYVTKPFSPQEVVARVKAVLRRVPDAEFAKAEVLQFKDLSINVNNHTLTVYGKEKTLTLKETELLWTLASNQGFTFSRERLLNKVWGYEYGGETRTVDSHIRSLRRKLSCSETTPWDIVTVWGVGYRFEVRS